MRQEWEPEDLIAGRTLVDPDRGLVAEEPGGDLVGEQVVIGAGLGTIDWAGERGEEVDRRFAVAYEFPPGEYIRRCR